MSRLEIIPTPAQLAEGKKLVEPAEVTDDEDEDEAYFLDQEFSQANESMADILAVIIEKELSSYCFQDYLLSSSCKVTADDSKKLVDWCFSIVDICSFQRETVASS